MRSSPIPVMRDMAVPGSGSDVTPSQFTTTGTDEVEAPPPADANINSRIYANQLPARRNRRYLFPILFKHVGDDPHRSISE